MICPLVLHPDPSLKERCVDVPKQDELWELKRDLWETLCAHKGYGLSAPQIGRRCRAFIFQGIFCSDPQIIKMGGSTTLEEEGCLSIPNTFVIVERSSWIKVAYNTLSGSRIESKLMGLDARVFQHEFDHLEGILILDRGKINDSRRVCEAS